nr:60S ribosomal protein L7a-1 [Tanacetum cinerariifolium]
MRCVCGGKKSSEFADIETHSFPDIFNSAPVEVIGKAAVELKLKKRTQIGVDLQLEWAEAEAFIEEAVGMLFSWCERFRCYNHMIYGIVNRSTSHVILKSDCRDVRWELVNHRFLATETKTIQIARNDLWSNLCPQYLYNTTYKVNVSFSTNLNTNCACTFCSSKLAVVNGFIIVYANVECVVKIAMEAASTAAAQVVGNPSATRPSAPKKGGKPIVTKKKTEKVVNPLFEKRPKLFRLGGALPPKKDVRRFVRWPQVVRIQRKRRILKQRLKVPPTLNRLLRPLTRILQLHCSRCCSKAYRCEVWFETLNHITYLIEQNKAQLVIIAYDVDPIELVVWLSALCRKMEIPYCIVKGKSRLGTIVHQKTAAALCLTRVENEDKMEVSRVLEAIKVNFNDKCDEYSKKWGGGIMGSKSQAKTKAKVKCPSRSKLMLRLADEKLNRETEFYYKIQKTTIIEGYTKKRSSVMVIGLSFHTTPVDIHELSIPEALTAIRFKCPDLELKNIDDNQLKEADMVVDDENNLVDTEIQEVGGDIDEEENLVATTEDTNSINEVNTANGISTAAGHSSSGQASSSSYIDDLMFSFFAYEAILQGSVKHQEIKGTRTEMKAQEEPTEFALMAYTSGSDTEKNEVAYEEKIAVLEFEVKDKGNYMPPLADLSFARLDDFFYRPTTNKASASISKGEPSVNKTSNIYVEMRKVDSVGDEDVHKELGDRMERAATTASSLEAEQDSEQFWQTAALSTIKDGVMAITATIDRNVKELITEAFIRRHLKLGDSEGLSTLPTEENFEQLALMGLTEANNKLSEVNAHLYADYKKSKDELKRRNTVEYATEMELECAKLRELQNKLSAHQDTISVLKQQKDAQIKLYKTREDKNIEKVIDLKNKVKVLDNIVYKTGQSVQMMNMLNNKCRTSFVKPGYLKKAKQANPRLYDIGCYNDNLALMLSPDSDE